MMRMSILTQPLLPALSIHILHTLTTPPLYGTQLTFPHFKGAGSLNASIDHASLGLAFTIARVPKGVTQVCHFHLLSPDHHLSLSMHDECTNMTLLLLLLLLPLLLISLPGSEWKAQSAARIQEGDREIPHPCQTASVHERTGAIQLLQQ